MAIEKVKKYFAEIGEPERVLEFEQSTATSELAAEGKDCKDNFGIRRQETRTDSYVRRHED